MSGRPGLVGRLAELRALREALGGLRSTGLASVLALAGDPGIGKTRLLAELGERAREAGHRVLTGRAAEFEREVPFGVFTNTLDDHLKGWSREPAFWSTEELRLLPGLFSGLAIPGELGEQVLPAERYRLHRAVRALLETVAEPAGLVLILDDLHWCDESSAELLDHLLRHPPRAPVLLAVAYRPRQLPARVHRTVAGCVRRGVASVVEVGALTFVEARTLLPAGVGRAEQEALYEVTGGNPLYLEVLARERHAGQVAGWTGANSVPPPVRAALAGEFAALPAVAQRVAHAAAVAGDAFDVTLVAAVAEVDPPEVLTAFDELGARDLIRGTGPDNALRFRHPLVRSAAYHHARLGWRVGAHARAAAELARRGAPLAERAGHVELSAAPGDLAAVRTLGEAAARAMNATPAAAAHWLGSALRLLPEQPDNAGTRLALLGLRARALGVTGHVAQSRDLLDEVLRMIPAGADERVAVVTFLSTLEHLLGNHERARALLTTELDGLPDRRGRAAAALQLGVVLTGVVGGRAERDAVEESVDLARGVGERPLLASALGIAVLARNSFEAPDARTQHRLDEAARLVDAMPESELAQRLDAGLFLGWAEAYLERFADATRHLTRTQCVARATGQSHLISSLNMLLGVAHSMTGDLDQAQAALDDAMESAVLTGGEEARGRVLAYQAWVAVWRGDAQRAVALAREAAAIAPGAAAGWQVGSAETMLAFSLHAAGDPDGCLETLLRAGRGSGLSAIRPAWKPQWFELLAAAATAGGHHREAVGYAARAGRLPAIDALPRQAGFARLAQVHPLLASDPHRAAQLAEEAAGQFTSAGDRLGAAQAQLHAAAAHHRLGASADAGRAAARARRAFAGCGADPGWLVRLAGVGLTPDSGTPAAAHRLTPRELAVLRLLAGSFTAATIARRLDISVATVHKHLSALYRKLGTGDRLATVLRAKTLGLLPDDYG